MIRGLVVAGWLAVACAPGSGLTSATGVTQDDAIIYLQSNVRDAQVYIDGRFIASLDALHGGIAVDPGSHRLELRREDYFSSYLELQLARAEHRKLAVELAAILP